VGAAALECPAMDGQKPGKRIMAILLAIVSAAGLAVAAFAPKWLADSTGDGSGFGLLEHTRCGVRCVTVTNFELVDGLDAEIARIVAENKARDPQRQLPIPPKPWGGFPVVGWMAWVSCLLAAAGLLVATALAIARKRIEWTVMPTTVVVLGLLVGMVTGCIFIATKPAAIELMGVGWTFGVFGGGVVVGIAAVFPLNRQIRPIDEELGAASATMSWGGSRDD
jgi:hypothetical protein